MQLLIALSYTRELGDAFNYKMYNMYYVMRHLVSSSVGKTRVALNRQINLNLFVEFYHLPELFVAWINV